MKKIATLCLITLISLNAFSQPDGSDILFASEDPIPITLSFDIRAVTSDIEERNEHPAELKYVDTSGETITTELQVSVRGKTRANPQVCRFPPIEVNFKKKGNVGNVFEGQDKLKLVTHCQSPAGYDQYVINEYLIYKAYSLLTDKSLKVRLLKITYNDTAGKEKPMERMGFLIEDIDYLAARHDLVEIEKRLPNQDMCDHTALDIFTVFQYLIGNTDWSISTQHNVKLIGLENNSYIAPVPYDFDYSGILSTSYALAPENLPIATVKDRLFRGFCRKSGEYEKTFQVFQDNKQGIYDTFLQAELLSDRNKKRIEKYLDSFYAVLDDPRKASREINGACRLNHEHLK